MPESVILAILAIIGGSIIGPSVQKILSRRGDDAKAKVDEVTADASAAAEWQALYAQLRTDVDNQRIEIADLRADVLKLTEQLTDSEVRNKLQASLLRSVCRWALLLRDELLRLGAHVPAMPPDVEAAFTTLEA